MARTPKQPHNDDSSTEEISLSIRNLGIGIFEDGTWSKQSDWGFGESRGFTLQHKLTGAEIMFCLDGHGNRTVKGIYANDAEEDYLAQVLFDYNKAVGPCQTTLPESTTKVTALGLRRYVDEHYGAFDSAGPAF